MKKIIITMLLVTSLQVIAAPAGFIITRAGLCTVEYLKDDGTNLFSSNNIIALAGNTTDHTSDQMVLIPLTSVINPQTNAPYKVGAARAKVTIGSTVVNVPLTGNFVANTSYVIAPGTTPGTFTVTPGLITYDTNSTTTAVGTPGNPSPVAPGAGF